MPNSNERAPELLDRHGLTTAPIPIDVLAEKMGIIVVYDAFDDETSGMLIRGPVQSPVIGVNSSHPKTRQRFTIAHEIGHYLLDSRATLIVDKSTKVNFRDAKASTATDKNEIKANQIAADLLMPRNLVIYQFARNVATKPGAADDEIVSALASTFDVSLEAMKYRLVNLGLRIPS